MAKTSTPTAYANLSIGEIADVIAKDWPRSKRSNAAVPYLSAMFGLNKITDPYGMDSGVSIVLYFLNNATSWKGDVAREVKAELRKRVK